MAVYRSVMGSLVLILLTSCASAPIPNVSSPDATPAPTPAITEWVEHWPESSSYQGKADPEQILADLKNPIWETLWLRGHYLNGQTGNGYYVSAWLSRTGAGILSVSSAQSGEAEENFPQGLVTAYTLLTNGKSIFSPVTNQISDVNSGWQYHSLEKADPFLRLFFPATLLAGQNWQIGGISALAGRDAVVLSSTAGKVWVDEESGVPLGVELKTPANAAATLQSMRVLEIAFDIPLPHQVNQPVPTGDDKPGLYDRPASVGLELAGKPLHFDWVPDDVTKPQAGSSIDIYDEHTFIGSVSLGFSGLYCDRSPDGNYLAYLYSSDSTKSALLWVDLRKIESVHSFEKLGGIGSPVWSPDATRLLFSAKADDIGPGERKLYMLTLGDGQVVEIGTGSLVTPAWTDDGSYVYSLNSRYTEINVYDAVSSEHICRAAFDSNLWVAESNSCGITKDDVATHLPRSSFDFLTTCSNP